jgi:hypothetical protein
MKNQLLLLDSTPAWRLDRATRAQGLDGVRKARAILHAVDARRSAEGPNSDALDVAAEAA